MSGLDFAITQQAHRTIVPNLVHRYSCGLVIRFQLLPTLPHDNAVIFNYGLESVYPMRTCTSLIVCAHERTILSLRDNGFINCYIFYKYSVPLGQKRKNYLNHKNIKELQHYSI